MGLVWRSGVKWSRNGLEIVRWKLLKGCRMQEEKESGVECHSIKELDPKLIGRRWAALRPSNVTALGVQTYADFMQAQVRACAGCADVR